ncbi:MAG: FHA domain-containing protein [Pseudomonadales bacterium]|nr:FHA domain-containing protein [Pseudomonadales bacterium]MCP5172472.1 FHA domain-containing protein [Pseudomonadales bacterium]
MSNNDGNDGGFFNNPTRRVGGGADATIKKGAADTPTVAATPAVSEPAPTSTGSAMDINPQTRRVRPGSSSDEVTAASVSKGFGYHPEFVVGWLVVVEGPGRGMSKPLGYGMNPVGREEETGVQLNFGDEEISRKAHCQIAYDHKNKKFYIQHGGGQNLTYLGNEPVLSSSELHKDATISIGNTTLKFVQLCGDDFDWEQQA